MTDDATSAATTQTSFRSADGLLLRGTFVAPSGPPRSCTVLVHGGGVTREEGGFFGRLAAGLTSAGVASLRFDFRGHGESEGRQEDLTLSGVLNDIRAAVAHARELSNSVPVNLLGASFSGGICAYFAAEFPMEIARLILINPLVNYKKRFIDDKPYWNNDQIAESAGRELIQDGFLPHSTTFKLGRPLLNEVFYLRPDRKSGDIQAPTLILHGTGDTFIPVQSSRDFIAKIAARAELIEIEGAQHGIAVHDDPQYRNPQTQIWQAKAIEDIAAWSA
ncbi:alpha/beta hydrolase [Actinoplanes derwentensis]|uniref:Lysophospholipase, alpha-beta hydrolase superfamily n=3 Tax=Actinoplanes derwentensis TaxID=113562 RepID=A0A1H1XTK5_9ACTN|nr:alpha/beta fold hydrolase [Actinoplanes derwentensis]SDT12482.1 Lysophospholipase, alpha-beta hydrolase superfamily [Actinoplanes derwentensis]